MFTPWWPFGFSEIQAPRAQMCVTQTMHKLIYYALQTKSLVEISWTKQNFNNKCPGHKQSITYIYSGYHNGTICQVLFANLTQLGPWKVISTNSNDIFLADGALEKLKFCSGIPSQINITRGQNTFDIPVCSTLYILHVWGISLWSNLPSTLGEIDSIGPSKGEIKQI